VACGSYITCSLLEKVLLITFNHVYVIFFEEAVDGLGLSSVARDIMLCSWARHLILSVPFSTQVYKWVLANLEMLGGGGGKPRVGITSHPRWGGGGGKNSFFSSPL